MMGLKELIRNITGSTLYYSGCFENEEISKNYKEILNLIGIKYITFSKEEFSCGSELYELGYKKDFRNHVNKSIKFLEKNSIKKIITNCSVCYYLLKKIYPTINKEFNIEVEHIIFPILNYLKKKSLFFEKKEALTYQDPCYLGRYCGIYEEPREIIRLLGGEINEFKNSKERAICCGAAGGLPKTFPELSKDMAKKRIDKLDTKIITSCSMCQNNFEKVSNNSLELSSFILNKLKEKNDK